MTSRHPPELHREPVPDKRLSRIDRLAWLLDSSIPLPLGRSVGIDGIIGLVPGIGDALGAGMSLYIVMEAWRMRASPAVLARMLTNIGVETVVGLVPILGDLFDFAFKANQRNIALLRENITDERRARRSSTLRLLLLVVVAVAAVVAVATLIVAVAGAVWARISAG